MPGITLAHGRFLGEAAAVCLEAQQHNPGATLQVDHGAGNDSCRLSWQQCTEQQVRCHNDFQEATEFGACGIAIELVRELTGLVVVLRSRKGTGFDYWLGHSGDESREPKARLEVSGILNGNDALIRSRLRAKLAQMEQSIESGLPGYVAILSFSAPEARVAKP